MNFSENNNSQKTHQFLPPGKIFKLDEAEDTTSFETPEIDVQHVPPLFHLPTTDRQHVPSLFQLPTTDRQATPPPVSGNGIHTLSSYKYPIAQVQNVPPVSGNGIHTLSSYKYPVMQVQDVPSLQPLTSSTQSNVRPLQQVIKKRDTSSLDKSTPFIAVIFNILVIVAVLWVAQNRTFSPIVAQQKSTSPAQVRTTGPALNTITNNKVISPLLFGTNMSLFHDNDEPILNSEATRQRLKDIGVRVIRMPTRSSLNPQTEVRAAQAIKEIGAVPLIVMNGPEFKGGPLLESDMNTLNLLMPVFGNKELVYFEFGNESDLNGIKVEQYVSAWNVVIPSLKEAFPNARFIAPDNYQFTRRYLKTFLQEAQPRPDGVSWHEYTCSVNWTADFCLSLLNTWPIHFAQARAAMREAIGTELPIWISEWNYASDQQLTNNKPVDDGKYNNPIFINTWTTKAMELLQENRIFASLQYYATDEPMPLVSNGQIGLEGAIFQQEYKKVMVGGYTPPVMTVSEPAAIPPKNINMTLSFANGSTNGWSAFGQGITQPTISTTKAFVGAYSMKITLANTSEDAFPFISISHSRMPMIPKPGQMISAYIYVDNKAALVNAKIYVSEPNHNWHFSGEITLTPGQWNKVWYALPVNFTGQVSEIGLQFYTSHPGISSDVYFGGISIV